VKVSVTAKMIYDDKFGRLVKGQEVELPAHKAQFYLDRGEVEFYETKVLRDRPYPTVGTQQSASLAVEVLQGQTLNESNNGGKRRGRKPKG
jgi:hypothetical protein